MLYTVYCSEAVLLSVLAMTKWPQQQDTADLGFILTYVQLQSGWQSNVVMFYIVYVS